MRAVRTEGLERVVTAIEQVRRGGMVILVDDESRENEGDLCLAAEHVTAEHVNFMAKHARGLICLALTEACVERLGLPMMVDANRSSRGTAFTISIEARHGVTTGISAADRAHTIRTAVNQHAVPSDLVSPGHVFPLRARPGGVLQRTGHTEGSVDLARLAGCDASAVICEIMRDDGTMARRDDLERFAAEHHLPIVAIADLIEYRLQTERLVRRIETASVRLGTGREWTAHVYDLSVDQRACLALVLGEPTPDAPTLVRVQTGSVLGDVFGVERSPRVGVATALRVIEGEGRGVVLFLPGPSDLARDLAFHAGRSVTTPPVEKGETLREFGLGAQVLADLGLRRIRLVTNRPRRIVGVESFGLELEEPFVIDPDGSIA